MLEAKPNGCQEAKMGMGDGYIPCNRPATRLIKHRDEGPYRMCDMCADHNVRNRGGTDVGPFTPTDEEPAPVSDAQPAAAPDLSDYEADARLSPEQTENILSKITNTVHELLTVQREVADCEKALKAAQEREKNLIETQLPMLMDEAKQKRLTTIDGYEVERSEVVRASISQANMSKATAWLIDHGQASIVKRELSLKFGKGEEQRAAEAVDTLREHNFTPTDKMSVHPQTLGALVRELLAEGKEIPMDLLGVYVQPLVKIKKT